MCAAALSAMSAGEARLKAQAAEEADRLKSEALALAARYAEGESEADCLVAAAEASVEA